MRRWLRRCSNLSGVRARQRPLQGRRERQRRQRRRWCIELAELAQRCPHLCPALRCHSSARSIEVAPPLTLSIGALVHVGHRDSDFRAVSDRVQRGRLLSPLLCTRGLHCLCPRSPVSPWSCSCPELLTMSNDSCSSVDQYLVNTSVRRLLHRLAAMGAPRFLPAGVFSATFLVWPFSIRPSYWCLGRGTPGRCCPPARCGHSYTNPPGLSCLRPRRRRTWLVATQGAAYDPGKRSVQC